MNKSSKPVEPENPAILADFCASHQIRTIECGGVRIDTCFHGAENLLKISTGAPFNHPSPARGRGGAT
ncbi:MAG: hypothetical protein JO269_10835 [Burkholderiaceae bacterium]|nr:hypothetical protein [Burkholderiaceae bacterium]